MAIEQSFLATDPGPVAAFESPHHPVVASYERELIDRRWTEIQLRAALARGEVQLLEQERSLQQQRVLARESDHRLLNGLQIIASLLSLQGRKSANEEVAAQLREAANRIATIERVHRRLHCFENAQAVAFKQYLLDLCCDFAAMLSSDEAKIIAVDGLEIELPSQTAIPLALIVNELITNAVKYGKGRISITLGPAPAGGHALSVCNEGPALPEDFDPIARAGLGMGIIQALVRQIGGELRWGRGAGDKGACFTVMFS